MASRDEKLLASLGYKQELRRAFSPWELFGLGFSLIGVFPSMASVLVYAIPNGGAAALVWGWAVSVFFLLFIAFAMAELGSAAPTSGGLYYWSHKFSSPRYKNCLSWVVGYSNSMGLIAGSAGISWGFAVQLMAAVSISSDMSFAPTTGQTFGVFVATLVLEGFLCSVAAKYLARVQTLYILFNVLLPIAVIIALPAATPRELKNSGGYAFGHFENLNGWPNGFAFILSFLSPAWTIAAFDPGVHVSEEASNAIMAVPMAIVASVAISGIIGWAVNVAMTFNMGHDLEAILDNPIGQPMASIFFNSFGKKGTLGLWSIVVVTQFMMATNSVTVGSRQVFAFSRDGGLPLSSFLRRINPATETPVYAVWFMIAMSLLLGLLAFAGPVAVSAIFALGVVGEYIALAVPISARYLGDNNFRPGAFTLGKLTSVVKGLPVATIAILWMGFMIVILMFPTTPATTASTMNYTSVVSGGVILLCLAYYFCPVYGGRYWFTGPIRTVDDSSVSGDSGSISQDDGSEKGQKSISQ